MADAAGLAVGLVSLGLQVSSGITKYIDALNCRENDIASVKQQNVSLQKLLRSVETSLSAFQASHEVATDAMRECMQSSRKELSALENLLVEITAFETCSESRRDKLKGKGKKLLYPFSRPKVEQLETRLANANVTLQLAQQSLQLSVSQLGVERLARLERSSQAITFSVHAAQSTVSSIRAPLQDLSRHVSGIGARVEGLEALLMQVLATQPADDGIPQRITPAVATGRLVGKPSLLKDVCDAAEAGAKTKQNKTPPVNAHGATRSDDIVPKYTGRRYSCICRHRRRLRRKDTVWGSFTLSFEESSEEHLSGCPATQVLVAADQSRKLSLTYTGLRRMLNTAIQISFALPWGAGAGSLGPTFAYYPTVDARSAPAFRIVSLMTKALISHAAGGLPSFELLITRAVSAILRQFRDEKESPRAVDDENRSLVHYLGGCIRLASLSPISEGFAGRPLIELLECLIINKSPVIDYDLFGQSPLFGMLRFVGPRDLRDSLLGAATELILQQSSADARVALPVDMTARTGCAFGFRYFRDMHYYWDPVFDDEKFQGYLDLLATSTRIAEAYGCGPLSLAVITENLAQVENLVKNHPATLAERNLLGHTPLHLAADKPSCLRLLVVAADARLLNQTDTLDKEGVSALEAAVTLSGRRCSEPATSRMCRGCRCAEIASERCKRKCIRHIRDRRDRLKQLARDNLSVTQVKLLGLKSGLVLDASAAQVIRLLEDRGVQVPEALAISRVKDDFSIYQVLESPEDAELFFRVGFRDTDSWCEVHRRKRGTFYPEQGLRYLHWLSTHGASTLQPSSITSVRDIRIVNFTFYLIGRELEYDSPLFASAGYRTWVEELHHAALLANVMDSCDCECSPGGCTPLSSLLKGAIGCALRFDMDGFVKDDGMEGADSREESVSEGPDDLSEDTGMASPHVPPEIGTFARYLRRYGSHLRASHHISALRHITFTALSIQHTCCYLHQPHASWDRSPEDTAEFNDEHAHELERLEELLTEFEGKLNTILQDPDRGIEDLVEFWENTWVRRTWEVLESLEGSDLGDDERRAAEEIGVVWDRPQPPEVPQNPYGRHTMDHWMYELEKIEAESA